MGLQEVEIIKDTYAYPLIGGKQTSRPHFFLVSEARHLSSYHRAITENKMTFTQSIKTCLSKYATFSGTASRSEFWWFFLFSWLLIFAAAITDVLIYGQHLGTPSKPILAIHHLAWLVIAIPCYAVGSRRLHDIGKSGWWQLLYITIIGIIPLMIMFAIDTKNKDNRFKPKSRRMTFIQSIKTCLSKYATFSGTASRSEFWWFVLFSWLLYFVAVFTDALIYDLNPDLTPDPDTTYYLVWLALLIPGYAVGSRRLHDIGNSGWWQLLYITVIGVIPLMIMFAIDTKNKDNRFKPKSRRKSRRSTKSRPSADSPTAATS